MVARADAEETWGGGPAAIGGAQWMRRRGDGSGGSEEGLRL